MLSPYCPTSRAVFLVGFPDPSGLLRFPSQSKDTPGIHLAPKALLPIAEQLRTALEDHLKDEAPAFEWRSQRVQILFDYSETVVGPDDQNWTLYLGRSEAALEASASWHTLPILLRAMPKTRSRLAYMKAMQQLAGAAGEDIQAVESKDLPT